MRDVLSTLCMRWSSLNRASLDGCLGVIADDVKLSVTH